LRRLKVVDVARITKMSKTTLHKLYNEQSTRIDFETIDKLYKLLNVEVGDFLKYVPKQENDESENLGLVSKQG
jgi:putative transcriptional regulator